MTIKTFYRTRLPHLVPVGATFFITFRLADSLPQKLIRALQVERETEIKELRNRDPNGYQKLIPKINEKYFARYEHQLDEKPYGNCYLRRPEIAQIVADRLQELDGKFYELQAYCIMPNHVHILINTGIQLKGIDLDLEPEKYTELWKIMHRIKGYTGRRCNELLSRAGAFWFKDSYDHFVRNRRSWERILSYILQNPVKAGLVKHWKEWPFSGVGFKADDTGSVDLQGDDTMKTTPYKNELIQNAILRMDENTEKIKKCLRELTEEEVWRRPNASSNSVGNLLLHLCGNIRQYAISSLGRRPDVRQRDKEFAAKEGYSKAELFSKLAATVEEAITIFKNVNEEELLRIREVQAYEFSGIGVIMHVVEHYSYHTGQIVFWTKLLRDQDLGFYSGVDLG